MSVWAPFGYYSFGIISNPSSAGLAKKMSSTAIPIGEVLGRVEFDVVAAELFDHQTHALTKLTSVKLNDRSHIPHRGVTNPEISGSESGWRSFEEP
jgi:hypothetical protein